MRAARWLFYAAIFTEISGFLMVVGASIPDGLVPLARLLFGEDVALGPPARLATGIAGAVLAGWAVTISLMVRKAEAVSLPAVGTSVVAGIAVWFVLDAIVTIVTGAYVNLLGNIVYLLIFVVPALSLCAANDARGRSSPDAARVRNRSTPG